MVALVWLVRIVVRESGAATRLERAFVALIPLSMYATGATIGNGQLTVHILPALLTGLLLLSQKRSGWGRDALAAALILLSLVKPAVSIPFFWIVLFVPGRLRPAILVTFGYVAVTFFAGPLLTAVRPETDSVLFFAFFTFFLGTMSYPSLCKLRQ